MPFHQTNAPYEIHQKITIAIREDDIDTLKSVLDTLQCPIEKNKIINSPWPERPLCIAANCNNTEIIALLLEHGANPNLGDTTGYHTALHWAAKNRNFELCQLLIQYGAVNQRNIHGLLPIDCIDKNKILYDYECNDGAIYSIRINLDDEKKLKKLFDDDIINEDFFNVAIENNIVLKNIKDTLNSLKIVEHETPKDIHFIWIGSKKIGEYIYNIISAISFGKKENFIIHLWIDNVKNIYKSINSDESISHIFNSKRFVLHQIDELNQEIKNRFSKEEARLIFRYISDQTIGLKNPPRGSDLLRALILLMHGGFYFDTDTISIDHIKGAFLPYGIKFIFIPQKYEDQIDINVIASIPSHPFFVDAIKEIIIYVNSSKEIQEDRNSFIDGDKVKKIFTALLKANQTATNLAESFTEPFKQFIENSLENIKTSSQRNFLDGFSPNIFDKYQHKSIRDNNFIKLLSDIKKNRTSCEHKEKTCRIASLFFRTYTRYYGSIHRKNTDLTFNCVPARELTIESEIQVSFFKKNHCTRQGLFLKEGLEITYDNSWDTIHYPEGKGYTTDNIGDYLKSQKNSF